MRKSLLHSATAAALAAGVLTIAQPAAADDGIRHVDNAADTCTDTGAGTAGAPFCTVGAAVAGAIAGQTVEIRGGLYDERVTVTGSGTPEQPITIRFVGQSALEGPNAGFVVDGGNDIRFENLRAWMFSEDYPPFTEPVLDLRDASAVTVDGGVLEMMARETPGAPVVRLSGVTESLLTNFSIVGTRLAGGITMDAGTGGVTVDTVLIRQQGTQHVPADNYGIRVEGAGNTVVNTDVWQFRGAAVLVGPSATGAVIANNAIRYGGSHGIHNAGAKGTAIANNTIVSVCGDGIRVDGEAGGVSVQNNRMNNGFSSAHTYCDPALAGQEVEIRVDGRAVGDTVVDYNNVHDGVTRSTRLYSWAGTAMSLADFRATSGQAAHDNEVPFGDPSIYDSANSAAPGFQLTDIGGLTRADDPERPNTGAGPIPYADRGANEYHFAPNVHGSFAVDVAESSVTVDASASTPRTSPIASYKFHFGDGAVVDQTSPLATHRYTEPGTYSVSVTVIAGDGKTSTTSREVSVLRRTASLGLLSVQHRTYTAVSGPYLRAGHARLGAAGHFDLVDAGSGQVALFARATGTYVSVNAGNSGVLAMTQIKVGDAERFTMSRNSDGSISLKSVLNGRYVGAMADDSGVLLADQAQIGALQRFHQVMIGEAGRTMTARANGKFVTAESAGTKPLIAGRTSAGGWERFDVLDLGNGQVALFSHANGLYVTAEDAGALPLIADRYDVGGWEKFTLVHNSDGTISFKAAANNRYVTADEGGAKPLIANRTSIGGWEKFTLG